MSHDMHASRLISGAGGGGKGRGAGRVAQEDPNTLRSKATAYVLDLLGEGEIEGIVGGLQGIYLYETPLQNADGSFNYSGVVVDTRYGLPQQSHIAGVSVETGSVVAGGEFKKFIAGNSQTFWRGTIPNPSSGVSVDAVRLIVQIDALFKQDKTNGDMRGNSVDVKIEVSTNLSLWTLVYDDLIEGKCMSPYQRGYRVDRPAGLAAGSPWYVRVRRETEDAPDSAEGKTTRVNAVIGLLDEKFSYPHSALVGLQVDTSSFGESIPQRAYKVRGLKVRVPSNYNPVTRAYSGTYWNGQFAASRQYTNNPVWVFYDLLTNPRYGLGDVIAESNVDKYALYEIAKYCDELVPNGFGGTEPRFTFNGIINTQQEAYTVLQSLASAFRGMTYWANGLVYATQDSPKQPVQLVAPANVSDGSFIYASSTLKERHSTALVTWNDPQDFYRPAVEVVEDKDALLRYGYRSVDVVAFGCTSRAQARRLGVWMLATEKLETETIAFTTSMDHILARPGQIIEVRDPATDGARLGGRVAPMDDLCIAASGANLITKATFEDRSGGAWWSNRPTTTTTNATTMVSVEEEPWRTALGCVDLYTYASNPATTTGIAVTAGTVYNLAGWLNTQGTTQAARFGVEWRNSSGALLSRSTGTSLAANSVWTYRSGTVTAPTGATRAYPFVEQVSLTAGTTGRLTLAALPYFGTAAPFANNGAFTVIKLDSPATLGGADTITVVGYDDERAISTVSRSGSVVTVTSSAAHGLTTAMVGRRVTLKRVTNATFNGTQVITSVPNTTTFTFADTQANATSSGGVWVLQEASLLSAPVIYAPDPQPRVRLSSALPQRPMVGAMWVITSNTATGRKWRITTVRESAPNEFEVAATRYVGDKFAAVDANTLLEPVTITRISTGAVTPPSALEITETLFRSNNQTKTRISLSWVASTDTRVANYAVEMLTPAGITTRAATTRATGVDLTDLEPGVYTFRVYAETLTARSKALSLENVIVAGKSAPPSRVTGFAADPELAGINLYWSPVEDLDLVGYEIRETYPNRTGGQTWDIQRRAISSIVRSGSTITVTTSVAHGFVMGEPIRIEGAGIATPPNKPAMTLNGAYTVASVPNSTTLTMTDTKLTTLAAGDTSYNITDSTGFVRFDNTLVDRLKGTSFFVPLQDSATHTYMIKALDDTGNYSEEFASLTTRIGQPNDVTSLTAVAQEAAVQLAWDAVPGVDVEYEIRAGQSWDLGQFLAKTSATTYTVLFPGSGVRTFWVRARSKLGLESNNPVYAQVLMDNPAFRNVVLTNNYKTGTLANGVAANFATGVRRNMEYVAASSTLASIVNEFVDPTSFDTANWTRSGGTISANVAVDANNLMVADRFVETNAVTTVKQISQNETFFAGRTYAVSIEAEPSGQGSTRFLVIVLPSAAFGSTLTAIFNVSTGAVTQSSAGVTAYSEPLANGFYRCIVAATTTANAVAAVNFRISNSGTVSTGTHTGDGVSGLLLANAMGAIQNAPTYGEYFVEIDLGSKFRARNWLDSEFVLIDAADSIAWQAATFEWFSDEASRRSWIASGEASGARADRMIAAKADASPTDLIFGAELDNAPTDVTGATVSYNTGTSYAAHVIRNGVAMTSGGSNGLSWSKAVPATFALRGTVRMLAQGTGGLLGLRNTTPNRSMTVERLATGVFRLTCSDGLNIDLPTSFAPANEDYITFGISQSGSTRVFAAYAHRSRSYAMVTRTNAPAMGTFDQIALGTYTWALRSPVWGNIECYNSARTSSEAMGLLVMNGLSPVGYTDFVPLTPGDYDYRYAILAVRASAPFGRGRPALSEFTFSVDVPDVNEQATVTVGTAGWVSINFVKKFTRAPAVMAFQAGGGAAPALGETRNITTAGFELRLVNPTTGEAATGTAVYLAVGY
jgi:predicted phage tail protein